MQQEIRTFIATSLSSEVHAAICEFQDTLKKRIPGQITWVKPDSMHLTLKFLGNIAPAQIDPIHKILQNVLAGEKPFTVHARGFGVFPHPGAPRVLWVGLREDTPRIAHIHEVLEKRLEELEIPAEDKEYRLHITLGRAKGNIGGNVARLVQEYADISFGSCQMANVVLFQSVLQPSGSIYTPLKEVHL